MLDLITLIPPFISFSPLLISRLLCSWERQQGLLQQIKHDVNTTSEQKSKLADEVITFASTIDPKGITLCLQKYSGDDRYDLFFEATGQLLHRVQR